MNDPIKSTYVRRQITQSLLELMREKPIDDISICDITKHAGVGRASFYRNYRDKIDVIDREVMRITQEWGLEYEKSPSPDIAVMLSTLFSHYAKYKDFYRLLQQQGLSHLILNTTKAACGPRETMSDASAFISAFIAYGLYGWIDEWIRRDFPSDIEDMQRFIRNISRANKRKTAPKKETSA